MLLPPCYARHRRIEDEIVIDYPSDDVREHFATPANFDYTYGTTGIGAMPSRLVNFDRVLIEPPQDDVRPDAIGYFQSVPLYIEVAVTHFVGAEKLSKLRARGVSALELDFSAARISSWEAIEHQLLASTTDKKWLINRVADQLADKDRRAREERTEESRKQQHWPVTHESDFDTDRCSRIRVFLSPCFVGVQLKSDLSGTDARKYFYDTMKAVRASTISAITYGSSVRPLKTYSSELSWLCETPFKPRKEAGAYGYRRVRRPA